MPLQLLITGNTPDELRNYLVKLLCSFKGVEFTPTSAPMKMSAIKEMPKFVGGMPVHEQEKLNEASQNLDAARQQKRRGRPPKIKSPAVSSPSAAVEKSSEPVGVPPTTGAASPAVESDPSLSTPAASADDEMPSFLKRKGDLPTEPTKDTATNWLKKVTETISMEKGIEVIKSIGESRMSTLPPEKYGALIEACQKALTA